MTEVDAMMVLFSTIAYFPSVLYFCPFVSFRFFSLQNFFRYALLYVRTGSYTPATSTRPVGRKVTNQDAN